MEYLGVGIFFVLFFIVAWSRFRWAIGGFIIGLPIFLAVSEHILKFKIGPIPTTLIEGVFGILLLIWLVKFAKEDIKRIIACLKKYRVGSIFGGVFLLASAISIFTSGDFIPALGIWRAYFLEPALLFLILIGRMERKGERFSKKDNQALSAQFLITSLIISTISIAVYGIYQHIVGDDAFSQGLGLPVLRRVTSFFTSPNAVGLYVGPVLFLLSGLIIERLKSVTTPQKWKDLKIMIFLVVGLLSMIVLGLTKSEGAFVALGAGAVVMLFFMGFRKIAVTLSVLAIIIGVGVPRIRQAILFHDPSGRVRLSLWQNSWDYLVKSPTHFVFGAGLRQFHTKIQAPAQNNNFTKIEKQLYPHNVVLNFWVETGLFGMLSFFGLIGYAVRVSLKILKKDNVWGASLLAMIAVVVVHGLVDVPYFKNDLAMVWWFLMVIILYTHQSVVSSPRLEPSS